MKKNSVMHTFVVLAYKESEYLEECIKSVLNQSIDTNVVIATSTPNNYIYNLAKKYKLEVIINDSKEKGIGNDFNFAVHCVESTLVTVAHQDDLYEFDYAEEIINNYINNKNSIILFTNYYEIRNNEKLCSNKNLNIKKILLFPLKFKCISNFKFIKRSSIRFGNAICCPSVTYVTGNVPKKIFKNKLKSNIDWEAWELLSKIKGKFIFIDKNLMGHRVHQNSTTSKIIADNTRTQEDLEMFKMFWPNTIAKFLNKLYISSEKSNKVE